MRCSAEALLLALLAVAPAFGQADAAARFDSGLQQFRARHFGEAVGAFLEVLQADPGNKQAREYEDAALKALVAEREEQARRQSLELLASSLGPGEKERVAAQLCAESAE